jgi:2-haloacid dehalogenase
LKPKALLFDVFGTVVDWRSGLIRDLQTHFTRYPSRLDPAIVADAWRAEYQPSMTPIRDGTRPFTKLDVLHRENLQKISADLQFDLGTDADTEWLVQAWHRLPAWPDSVRGIDVLKEAAICASQSNGHIALAVNLARYNGFSWDAILGAEVVGTYKPAPESYTLACDALGLSPSDCMMVAAHNSDLAAARRCGLQTAFIQRPTEHGPNQSTDLIAEDTWDFICDDLEQLAQLLRR